MYALSMLWRKMAASNWFELQNAVQVWSIEERKIRIIQAFTKRAWNVKFRVRGRYSFR